MRMMSLVCLSLAACSASSPVAESAANIGAVSPPRAELDFQVGWVQVQRGAIVRSGHVDVSYDALSRLSNCASPTVLSFARFQPGGQQFSSDEAFGFDVPDDATSVEL